MFDFSVDYLKSILHYNHETGDFTWLVSNRRNLKGKIAGFYEKGYRRIGIKGKWHFSHRLAWYYYYGEINDLCIDHINGIKDDNRICNLRLATKQQNSHNMRKPNKRNSTGYMGVCLNDNKKRFVAAIRLNNKPIHIGTFDTAQEAHDAYLKAKRELHEYCTI